MLPIILGLSGLTAAGVIAVIVIVLGADPPAPAQSAPVPSVTASASSAAPAEQEAAPASVVVHQFGSKGTQPGQFDDPRAIAVDRSGTVFVADYVRPRLQVFGGDGTFQRRIDLGDVSGATLTDIATDYGGNLYAVILGDIRRYDIESGDLKDTFKGSPTRQYRTIAVDAANMVYALALNDKESDIYKLNASGKVLSHWKQPLREGNTNTGMILAHLLVPETGGLYATLDNQSSLITLDAKGKFVDRMNMSKLCKAGMGNPATLDGKGDLLVGNRDLLVVCTVDGQIKKEIALPKLSGSVRDMAVAPSGLVYVTTNRDQVLAVKTSE